MRKQKWEKSYIGKTYMFDKEKNILLKCHMAGSKQLVRDSIKTNVCTLVQSIPKKNTWLRMRFKFNFVVRSKPRITKTPKYFKMQIIWDCLK